MNNWPKKLVRFKPFRCERCAEYKMRQEDKYQTTCAFDGEFHLFKPTHYQCLTILALKDAMRVVGKRTLQAEEREGRGTCWNAELDGSEVMAYWKRSYGKGFMELAVERGPDGWGPMSLDTANGLIALAGDKVELSASGLDEDEMFNLKERLGMEDE